MSCPVIGYHDAFFTRLLTAMTSEAARPFYRLGSRIYPGALPRDEFHEFLVGTVDRSGFGVAPEAADRILERADEVPYNVQRLAHEVWEMARSATGGKISRGLVDKALTRVVLRDDPAYTQIWTGLTENQKKGLKAVIDAGQGQLSDGKKRFRLVDPFFAAWLRISQVG